MEEVRIFLSNYNFHHLNLRSSTQSDLIQSLYLIDGGLRFRCYLKNTQIPDKQDSFLTEFETNAKFSID